MDCSEFLARYSDFRDQRLDPEGGEFIWHLNVCPSCRRYDEVVVRGGHLVRGLNRIRVSRDFFPRLQHRIFHLEENRRRGSIPGVVTPLAAGVAVAVSIFAALPLLQPEAGGRALFELPPVAALYPPAPAEVPSLFRAGPILVPSQTGTATTRSTLLQEYSPLLRPSARLASD